MNDYFIIDPEKTKDIDVNVLSLVINCHAQSGLKIIIADGLKHHCEKFSIDIHHLTNIIFLAEENTRLAIKLLEKSSLKDETIEKYLEMAVMVLFEVSEEAVLFFDEIDVPLVVKSLQMSVELLTSADSELSKLHSNLRKVA